MGIYKIVKLHFSSPLHLHRGKGGYDTTQEMLHSDTISSAMTAMGYSLDDSFDGLAFLTNLIISSAYPFYDKQYFLPKPMIKLPISIEDFEARESSKEAKKLKKLSFIEKDLFEKIINADNQLKFNIEDFKSGGRYLTRKPLTEFIAISTQQRVAVPTDGSDAKPFYLQRIHFDNQRKPSGLYFFIKSNSDTLKKAVELLYYLGEEGIGTDRAVGNGQFKVEVDDIELNTPISNYLLSLSLYWPTPEEISTGMLYDSSYNLIKRGGFIAGAGEERFRHLRKNSVFMFTEGSVFSSTNLHGRVGDLRPEWNDPALNAVYRSGKIFSIPIKVQEK